MSRDASALPVAIEKTLRSIRLRQLSFGLLGALALALSVMIVAMILAMIVDWSFVLFSPAARMTLTVATLGLSIGALTAAGVPVIFRALGWARAARDVDQGVPQLEERWTTVTSMAMAAERPRSAAAEAMLAQVTSEAVAMRRLVRPALVASPLRMRFAVLGLLASGVLLAGFLAVDWSQTSVLLRRFWSPTADITATQLTCLTGSVSVPRGESIELVTQLNGRQTQLALLTIEHDSGVIDEFEIDRRDHEVKSFVRSVRVEGSFRYRVQAGDDQTGWQRVTAIDYPELEEVQFTITAPEYVGRPPYEKSLIPARVKVAQGSKLQLNMKAASSLERLQLIVTGGDASLPAEEESVDLSADADGWYRFETDLHHDLSLRPALLNAHGLTNIDRRVCRIEVIADKAPVARIITPTEDAAVAPDDVINIRFEAHDDHGIESAELVVYEESATEGGEPKVLQVQPIPLNDQRHAKHVMAETQLDLKGLELEEGSRISYAVRVTDNRRSAAMPPTESGNADAEDTLAANREATDPPVAAGDRSGQQADPRSRGEKLASGDPVGEPKVGEPYSDLAAAKPDEREPVLLDSTNEPSPSPPPAVEQATATSERQQAAGDSGNEGLAAAETAPTPTDTDPTNTDPTSADPTNVAVNDDDPQSETDQEGSPIGATASDSDPNQPAAPERVAREGTTGGKPEGQDDSDQEATNRSSEFAAGDGDADRPSAVASSSQSNSERQGIASSASATEDPWTFTPQQSETGQNGLTTRRRLRIAERLAAVGEAEARRERGLNIRERVVQIDKMLLGVEEGLRPIAERSVAEANRGEQLRDLDRRLGEIEEYIASLRSETKDEQFAFVGLQMVDIGRVHVSPARNRVFAASRDARGAAGNVSTALQNVVRARELLAALLKRYDEVERDRELAESLDDAIKMYEVYVERRHQLLREARQNKNPLTRDMAIIEVDQAYLDRYAEVLTLRREMLREFGRMLADDPRLLSRYMDLIKRRRASFRDQLAELALRQDEIATELSGWLAVDEVQRDEVWTLLAEMRSETTRTMAKDAAALAERIRSQMPLELESDRGTSQQIINHGQTIAQEARAISFRTDALLGGSSTDATNKGIANGAAQLVSHFLELETALQRLEFERQGNTDVAEYVDRRLLESQSVAEQASGWAESSRSIESKAFHRLVEVDQDRIGNATELLRTEMLELESNLEDQFEQQGAPGVPGPIVDMVRDLHRIMEGITFNQLAATFALRGNRLPVAESQQLRALKGFERAEDLMDLIRRSVVAELDQYEVEDPDIADLEDPTLDEFLANLEREPNLAAQLGIPGRPRNLRVIAELMTNSEAGGDLLGESGEAARQRAQEAMRRELKSRQEDEKPETDMTEEERQQLAKAKEMQEMLEKSLAAIEEKAEDDANTAEQRRQLEETAEQLNRLLAEVKQRNPDAEQWERLVQSDRAKRILRALARGEQLPDEQWNKLLSTLEDGLWQVRGKRPPEEYRKVIEQYQDHIRRLTIGGG